MYLVIPNILYWDHGVTVGSPQPDAVTLASGEDTEGVLSKDGSCPPVGCDLEKDGPEGSYVHTFMH